MNFRISYLSKIVLAAFCAGIIPQSLSALADISDRWFVREFYNTVFSYGDDAKMQWTGNYDGTGWTGNYLDPIFGTVSNEWLEATRVRVNFYRTMAGVPAGITFEEALNLKCQASALMTSVNNVLNHYPNESYTYYTSEGAEAATGNLAYNSVGVNAIDGYMVDFGATNAAVGHRRWILYPQSTVMGSGGVPAVYEFDNVNNQIIQVHPAANTLWVAPDNPWAARPLTRSVFVAWPPAGYVPSDLVWSRWSFSLDNADFSSATVSMESGGNSIPVAVEARINGVGAPESSIVWVANNMATNGRVNWPTPVEDQAVQVTVDNVYYKGSFHTYNYTVTIFDPSEPGLGELSSLMDRQLQSVKDASMIYSVIQRPWSEGVQGRLITLQSANPQFDAEGGSHPLIEHISEDYTPVTSGRSGNGTQVFHLVHPWPDSRIEALELPNEYFVGGSGTPTLTFDSSLSWATEFQVASVDINLGDGYNWQSIWSQSGLVQNSNGFTPVTIDLSQWIGRTVRIRFRYEYTRLGSAFFGSDTFIGWAFDNIELNNVSQVTSSSETPYIADSSSFVLNFDQDGPLFVQARDVAFDGFTLEWGPVEIEFPWTFDLAELALDEWTDHVVMGMFQKVQADWAYSLVYGWVYIKEGIWMHSSIGWMRYITGDKTLGMWFYSPTEGFIYVESKSTGEFWKEPFIDDPSSIGTFHP